jgi:hypothetical protein
MALEVNHELLAITQRFRQLVVGILPRIPWFDPRPVNYGIYALESGTGSGLFPSALGFSYHYHSTLVPQSYFIHPQCRNQIGTYTYGFVLLYITSTKDLLTHTDMTSVRPVS